MHLALCMVASADGAVAVDGVSGGLGGPADLRALSRLRGANDVSLVGAGTVRDERYRPLAGSPQRQADRTARGLRHAPRLAIVTGSGYMPSDLPVFEDPAEVPLILTGTDADPDALTALEGRAELHVLTTARPTPAAIVERLAALGLPRVLCEGGPRLNQTMLTAGLVDEVFLTVAPTLVGGDAARIIAGDQETTTPLELVSVFEHAGDLLLRYRTTLTRRSR